MSNLSIGVLTTLGALVLYLLRRKQYNISWVQLLVILIVIGTTGAIGASLSSYLTQGSWAGRRAYGTVLGNTLGVMLLSMVWKRNDGSVMDYVSIPIMATYCIAKAHCIFFGCCYGIVCFVKADGALVRFPIQIVETLSLAMILAWLLILEKKQVGNGILWSLNVLWYGISRFAADCFRGAESERENYLIGMQSGQFWCLIVMEVGIILLYRAFKRRYDREPTTKEFLLAMIGKYPD